jgi:hypothetical protein
MTKQQTLNALYNIVLSCQEAQDTASDFANACYAKLEDSDPRTIEAFNNLVRCEKATDDAWKLYRQFAERGEIVPGP